MTNTFLIIDDDISIVKMISSLIKKNNLGKVVGELYSGKDAIDEILFYNPDILLIDYLLPAIDGVEIVKAIKNRGYTGKVIMISQVEDEPMISSAYNTGVLFFINKPINSIEVVNVIKNVSHSIELEHSLSVIKTALTSVGKSKPEFVFEDTNHKIENIFNNLGIIGDAGTKDLINIIKKAYDYNKIYNSSNYKLQDIYLEIIEDEMDSSEPQDVESLLRKTKALEQRIRRTIQKALSNMAELGVEDYYDPTFTEYANLLFDFKQVRQEMKYIENPKFERGRVNIKKFIEGIITKL